MSARRFRPGIDLPAEQVEANRRYWESDESVNGIAEAMGMSKGRLYDLLLPFDAEHACPACGSALGFAHRTARDRGMVGCEVCGFEGELSDLPPVDPTAAPSEGEGGPEEGAPPPHWTPGAGASGDGPSRNLLGAALVGMAAGLALAGLLRRR
jgi:hypothetical protein